VSVNPLFHSIKKEAKNSLFFIIFISQSNNDIVPDIFPSDGPGSLTVE
jgi:hypothetical protein